jgi:hypothetical protein
MINVITDSDLTAVRTALAGTSIIPKNITITSQELSDRLQAAIETIALPIRKATGNLVEYELERVTFTLVLTSSGEVSLQSMVKGGASIQSGIQITLVPKEAAK